MLPSSVTSSIISQLPEKDTNFQIPKKPKQKYLIPISKPPHFELNSSKYLSPLSLDNLNRNSNNNCLLSNNNSSNTLSTLSGDTLENNRTSPITILSILSSKEKY